MFAVGEWRSILAFLKDHKAITSGILPPENVVTEEHRGLNKSFPRDHAMQEMPV
jgi:hypothetical protein